jgi:hypothetical protein
VGDGFADPRACRRRPQANDASFVLKAGNLVWFSDNIAFALFSWELDDGGSAARAHHLPEHPDLAFPQQLNPQIAPPGWRPRFIDCLYLGFTNALAFSPTDVMPLVSCAKITMAVQSLLSAAHHRIGDRASGQRVLEVIVRN